MESASLSFLQSACAPYSQQLTDQYQYQYQYHPNLLRAALPHHYHYKPMLLVEAKAANTRRQDWTPRYSRVSRKDVAKKVGEVIAKSCLEKGITKVAFDRGGYPYHGRIEALADASREEECSRGTAGSFGRLKAQKVRDLVRKTNRMKQDISESDHGEGIVEVAPFDGSLEEQKRLDVFKGRRKFSNSFQSRGTRDMMDDVVTKEDKDHLMMTNKNGVGNVSKYQTMPTNSTDIHRARADSRVSATSLRGWGNGESAQNFRFKKTDISKQWQQLSAESDFFSRKSFGDLGCSAYMIESLRMQLYLRPSRIQAMAFVPVIGGKSCIIADQSGSGKTLAYLVPVIQRLRQEELQGVSKSSSQNPRMVILVPTTELASQVLSNCRSMSKSGVPFRSMVATGGFRQKTQLENLRQDLDVLIATPGRFIFLIKEGFLQLKNLRCAVLDEVDILFKDEEFEPALQSLISSSPVTTQYLFVTATLPVNIYNKIVEIFPDCEVIMGPGMHRTSPGLEEILVDCSGDDGIEKNPETAFLNKKSALLQLVEESPVTKTIVFCNKIETCRKVENALNRFDKNGTRTRVLPFHAALAQESRLANMEEFCSSPSKDNSLFFVCTDRASRGIDFAGVDHVVLFDFPRDPNEYVRRVGRTARGAGGKGKAFLFVVGKQVSLARRIIERNRKGHPLHDLPSSYEWI